jgi:hypothetical protein
MDVVGVINGFFGAIDSIWQSQYGVLAAIAALLLVALWSSGFFGRLFRIIEEMMFNNWQLALLGATAVALSLASGYTTFDGLRNFTSAPLLSVLISFGIQGVMLIVAWLIGESFATGMNQRIAGSKGFNRNEAVIGMGLGVALVGLVFYWTLEQFNAVGFTRAAGFVQGFRADWERFADVALYFTIALLLVAVIAFNFRRGGDLSVPYVQSVRIIVRNGVLWVMLLASMGASVFFSFDSHFNAIFPAEQKVRAAEIRTLNDVGRIVADIGDRAQRAQIAEAERLFDADGWKAYDAQLTRLAHEAQGAQSEIEKYFVQKMEDRRSGIVEQQERIAGAERNQTALLRKRDEAEAELQRIEPTIGALEAELAKTQATYSETRQAIAARRIDASAEDGGVEGTLKRGRGPVYRQRMAEVDELQRKLAITDEPRLKEAQKLRDRASARIVSLKREIATINGEVAKYKGETHTAEQRIKTAQAVDQDAEGSKLDPAHVLPAFERARAGFRQQPDAERLAALQAQCGGLLNAMLGTPAASQRVRGIDCDPKEAAEAAASVFALNAGLVAFQANCAGGSKLPQGASTDALLSFGRKCLQDSALISRDSQDLGSRLRAVDMNRDDKAHRFVVTWNAFLDGNRLAYLALALAIGVDALVFMAGLFGAAAVKSPLTDLEGREGLSADQLEKVIDGGLRATSDARGTLRAIVKLSQPLSSRPGFASEIVLHEHTPLADDIRSVLVAGASIGAVERLGPDSFLISRGLARYLYIASTKDWPDRKLEADQNELQRTIQAALRRDHDSNRPANYVLSHLHAIEERQGYVAEVRLGSITDDMERNTVRDVMNAGVALRKAIPRRPKKKHWLKQLLHREPIDPGATIYLVHSDLLKTLLSIRAGPSSLLAAQADTGRVRLNGAAEARPLPNREQRRLLTNGRVGNDAAREDDDSMRWRFRYPLLEALKLPTGALDGEYVVSDEAMAAAAELERQAGPHQELGNVLQRIHSENRRLLQEVERELAGQHEGDERALRLLRETVKEIAWRAPALMLLPERDLFADLIKALEKSSDNALLNLLGQLKDEIDEMNPADGAAWRNITSQLRQLNGGAPIPTH